MSFLIHLSPAGESFTTESGETVLNAAKRHNLALPHACQSGNCGACKAVLQSGETVELQAQNALSETEKAAGTILLCCVSAQSGLRISLPAYAGRGAAPVQTMPAKIRGRRVSGGYAVLTLALPKNKTWTFRAGQYLDILLPENQRRSYSIAGCDADGHTLELHVRHHAHGLFSEPLFSGSLNEGGVLRVQLPLGSFALNDSGKPIIMLATGTGIAPIKAMLAELVKNASARAVDVYWGMAHRADFYDLPALEQLVRQLPNARLHTVSSRDGANSLCGHVQDCALAGHTDWRDYEVYACGRTEMIADAQTKLTAAGLPENAFFADGFTAANAA